MAMALAQRLEARAREDDIDGAKIAFASLEQEMHNLHASLASTREALLCAS